MARSVYGLRWVIGEKGEAECSAMRYDAEGYGAMQWKVEKLCRHCLKELRTNVANFVWPKKH